jgi:Spy/CpxP family protein refolding chaperone
MKNQSLLLAATLAAASMFVQTASAQSLPAASKEELEVVYTTAIENRASDIVKALNLTDDTKAGLVHDIIVAQYRALRARDAAIDGKLKAEGKEVSYANRASELAAASKPLHDQFLAKLATALTPEQIVIVEDKLTYNKVEVTYTAYTAIVPNLTDVEKAKIMELLRAAREEAIDGGSAPEKSEIFQKYKNQINDYLTAQGHDMAKAFADWEAKQKAGNTAAVAPAAK